MSHTPTKRCDRIDRHDEHEWYEGNVFRRRCPGRTTTRQRVRSRREGHPRRRGNGTSGQDT